VESAGLTSSAGRVRTVMPSRSSTASARSAMAIWPNAVGWTWSAISTRRPWKPVRSTTSAPVARAQRSMIAFASCTFAPARGRPRSSGIVAVSVRSQRAARKASAAPLTGEGLLLIIEVEALAAGEGTLSFDTGKVHLIATDGRTVRAKAAASRIKVTQ